jgi:hypothetical protein
MIRVIFGEALGKGECTASTAAAGVGNGDFASVFGNYDIAGANGYDSLLGNNDIALVVGTQSYALAARALLTPVVSTLPPSSVTRSTRPLKAATS